LISILLPLGRFDFHFHVVFRDPNGKTLHAALRRRSQHGTGFNVEAGAVPGADDLFTGHHPFGQRAAAMRTGVLNCVASASDIENGEALFARFDKLSPSKSSKSALVPTFTN